MWVDDHFDGLGVFAAQCDLLQPSYLDIRHRVIDIGFLDKWCVVLNVLLTSCDCGVCQVALQADHVQLRRERGGVER